MSGGVEWELDSAWKMVKLGRQTGDLEMEQLGWLRYSEGLRNLAVSALASQLIPMLEEMRAMRSERQTDAKITRHQLDLIVIATELMQERIKALEVGSDDATTQSNASGH